MLGLVLLVAGGFLLLSAVVWRMIVWVHREEEEMAAYSRNAGWDEELPPTVCGACGDTFVPKFRGARECFRCWSQTQAGRDWRARKEAERERHDVPPRWNGIERRRTTTNAPVGFDSQFVRKLLQLCHPDKHKGSELANNVTAELLKMKGRM